MTTFATGTFPGATGTSLYSITEADAGTWGAVSDGSAANAMSVDGSNDVQLSSTPATAEAYNTNVSPSADMTVSATGYTASGHSGDFLGLLARYDKNVTATNTVYYEFRITNTGSSALTTYLLAVGPGVGGAGINYNILATGTISSSLYGTLFTFSLGLSGNVLTAQVNGSTVLSFTDTSNFIPGSGTQKYAGIKMYTSGAVGYSKLKLFTATAAGSALTTVASVVSEATAAGSEICWTPVSGATSYDVKRAATSGGTYTLLGNVLSTASPLYPDAGQYGQWYTVTAKNAGGSASASAAVQAPASAPTSAVSSNTVKNYSPSTRHNLLISAGGAESAVTITTPAFTEKSTQANLSPGPYSDFAVAIENMTGSALATYSPLTTLNGTLTVSSGRAVYGSAAVNTYDYWRSPNVFLCGALATGISAENVTGRLGIGIGVDASNGVWAEYNGADQTIRVYGKNAGTVTTFLASTASGLTNNRVTFALEICMASFVVWVQVGDTWSVLVTNTTSSATGSGFYDLRYNSKMATWKPMFYLGSNASETAATATLRDIRATGFNSIGKVREAATITHNDGTPLTQNGLILIAHDRCGFPQGTNTSYQAVTAIHAYDPETGKIVGNHLGCLYASTPANADAGFAAGTSACSDAKIIYDAGAGGFHVWFNDWDMNPTNTWSTSVYYQFVSGTVLNQDTLLSSPLRVTATGLNYPGTSSNILAGGGYTMYGVDVRQIGSYWYLTGTLTTNPVTSLWRTVVLRGSSPYQFDTMFVADLNQQGEGQTFVDIGNRLYIIAGEISSGGGSANTINSGGLYAWDFSDFATVINLGTVNITAQSAANAGSIEPQQPAFVAYNRGGRTKLQILGHDSQYVGGIYQVTGGFHAYEADLELEGWQFPARKGVPATTINTTTKPPAGQFGTI